MKVAVVGTCGSGKSTIAQALCERGYDAYVVGQEHSAVSRLWARRDPDALIYLDVSLDVVRQRRSPDWPEWLFKQQRARLGSAREAATIRIDTSSISVDETVSKLESELSRSA